MTKVGTHRAVAVLLSTLALGGCGTDPYAGESQPSGAGGTIGGGGGNLEPTAIYTISVAPNRLLDLVFMIDNSPSMAPKVDKLNAQFPKLIAALKDPNDNSLPDLRIAIIDSDLGTGGMYPNGSCGPNASNGNSIYGDQGKFRMINAASCGVSNSDVLWLETRGNTAVNFTGDVSAVFACLASGVGTQGCGEEHQLQAFEFALVASGLGNDAQHAMLRPNAYLGLVFLTDEDDCSAAQNDGIFGDVNHPELRGESASLRCATRAHACGGQNLDTTPPGPGYPTMQSYTTLLKDCRARTDACPIGTDTSVPTTCSPLSDFRHIADELKALKSDWTSQILVAGIFGWPLTDADMGTATYRIDSISNPNTADTAHPMVFDSWPVCYDPNHRPAQLSTFDPAAAGWGATAGLRTSAFVDEFGANGLKFSICQPDFSDSMKTIGLAMAKKLQNLCIGDKLFDKDTTTPGLQPDCRVVYRTPVVSPSDPSKVTYQESPTSIPQCPDGATSSTITGDCWQLTSDTQRCPSAFNGQLVTVIRTQAEIDQGPLTPGTKISMQCRTCPTSTSAVPVEGCNY